MTITKNRTRFVSSILIGTSLLLTGCDKIKDIPVGTGYAAKNICSDYFIGHLDLNTVKKRFVAPEVKPLPMLWQISVDDTNKTVAVRDSIFINQHLNVAYYREGFGCTLLHSATPQALDAQIPALYPSPMPMDLPWPLGNGPAESNATDIDNTVLQAAIETAFAEPGPNPVNTLAVAVVHQGQLVAERYAQGANQNTRLVSWSMSKSVTSTLIGLLHDNHQLQKDQPAPVPEWQGTDKQAITLTHLLHMASGLQWSETAQGDSPDQGRMLFTSENNPLYYLSKPLEATPGSVFNYSTGATSLLARIVQEQVGGTLPDTYRFINEALFQPLNIANAVLEFDTSGNPAAGSSLYMTARDWAKLGLLYARNGNWFGNQILSPDWIRFSLTPSPANINYGSQIWLNTEQQLWPYLPADSFAFRGFHQQIVLVIPAHDLIIVRMGVTFDKEAFDLKSLATGIIASLQPQGTAP